MRGAVVTLLVLTAAAGVAGCSRNAGVNPTVVLQDAADRTVGASSYRAQVWQDGRETEDISFDRRHGMTVKLSDGAEARQVGTDIYFRDAGSAEWLTGSRPGQSSIADFAVGALRSAQGASTARRADNTFEFDSRGVPSSAVIKGGYIVQLTQTYTSPVRETRRFRFSQFGHPFAVEVPPESQRRPAVAGDCTVNRRGLRSLVCASALMNAASPTSTTTAP